MLPPSERVFLAGPSGSGKSQLLGVLQSRHPRQIVIDVTGEWAAAPFAGTVAWAASRRELLVALQSVADALTWRVLVPAEALEPEEWVNLLTPVHQPGLRSYPLAVGGLVLVVHEASEVAGLGQTHRIRQLWLRGRHHGVSILAASQRAADVGRVVSSQSDTIGVFRTDEPIDQQYWRSTLRPEWYPELANLRQYECLLVDRVRRRAAIYTSNYRLVRHLAGAEPAEAPASED